MAYSICLVDDHHLVRGGLQSLIEHEGTFVVTAQYANGKELIDALPHLDPIPDVIVLDIEMPVMNGRQTLRALQDMPQTYKVLMLTVSADDETVLEMVRAGARGFLPKYCSRQELYEALLQIIEQDYYHSELEVGVLHQSVRNGGQGQGRTARIAQPVLTQRELQFLRLVCDKRELPYKLIADEMGVSLRTVDGYRDALFLKLDIKTKTGLVFYALRHRLVRIDE